MAFGFGVGIQRLGSIGVELRSELFAFTPPAGVRPTGFVFGDPTAAYNGVYAFNGTAWSKKRNLPDSLAVMTSIGGTANAITGSLPPFVAPGATALVILVPTADNTGAVTLNGDPVNDALGNALAAGALVTGRSYLLQVASGSYRVLLNSLGLISDISGLQAALDSKADGAATTAALGLKADQTYVDDLIDTLKGGVAAAYDTLAEIATAITGLLAAVADRVAYSAQTKTEAEKGQARANMGADALTGMTDLLINGMGQINQRVYTTVADDVYWCDRHYVLTQTAAITPSLLSDVANGLPRMMRLTQSQATAQRMGNAQIVESFNAKAMRGQKVTLAGRLRCSASQAVRFAVLEWTGTADAVVSDVINAWANGTYTSGQFFAASNVVVSGVGAVTPAAATLTDFELVVDVSANCNNLIVFAWTEGTAAQNVTLDIAWSLLAGDWSAGAWPYVKPRSIQQELALCERFGKVIANGVFFGTATVRTGGGDIYATAPVTTPMRATPTVFAVAGQLRLFVGDTNSVITTLSPAANAANTYVAGGSLATAISAGSVGLLNSGSANLFFDAEL